MRNGPVMGVIDAVSDAVSNLWLENVTTGDLRNPKTLETFNKVTSLLPDGGHGLIYLTNNEGLWILRYKRPSMLEPARKKPPCDSESQIMAMPPDCD